MAEDICLEVTGLVAGYASAKQPVLDGVSLSVPRGSTLVLLGPSGCGKTTVLRCIAGLHTPVRGSIAIEGRTQFDAAGKSVSPENRPIGMVFQSYALWPHMTVEGNIRFPLKTRRRSWGPADPAAAKIRDVLEAVGLDDYGSRYPWSLSGGQQQRVAIARAIVSEPSLLLLDEPLSNLDARVRRRLRNWLSTTLKQLSITSVLVTHDQSEALALGDAIAVMHEGVIVEQGSPTQLYRTPKTVRGARAVGRMNIVRGQVTGRTSDGYVVDTAWGRLPVRPGEEGSSTAAATVGFRPEHATPVPQRNDGQPVLTGTIRSRVYLGNSIEFEVSRGEETVVLDANPELGTWGEVGDELSFELAPGSARLLADDPDDRAPAADPAPPVFAARADLATAQHPGRS